MRQFLAITKKEWMEQIRTGKLFIVLAIFVIFGIMNPAIAKLTPWMYELLGDSMAEQGITITTITVDALTSWTQFYKNISMGIIVFVIMYAGILTTEYQKGTLINILTKGLARYQVIFSKGLTMTIIWTLCYWSCYGITYGYNSYFWDNSIAKHLGFAGSCVYLFGVFLIAIILLASSLFHTSTASLLMTGGIVALSYILSMVPTLTKYLPTTLLNAGSMLNGSSITSDYIAAIVITVVITILCAVLSILSFNQKRL